MNYQTPREYAEIVLALSDIGPMSSAELALYFAVSNTCMSSWLYRMRRYHHHPIAIVGWEKTGGNRSPVYGIGEEDVPEPPVDVKAAKREWYRKNVVTARGKQGVPKSILRKNNLFGVRFQNE